MPERRVGNRLLVAVGRQIRLGFRSCRASVPDRLGRLFKGNDYEPELRRMNGMVVAAERVRLSRADDVDKFHFYMLNRPELPYSIADSLGCRADEPADDPHE